MNYNNIEKATKLKQNIDTLKLEIEQILTLVNAKRPNKEWLFHKFTKVKLREKTYKGYFCSRDIDSIGSCITVNPREALAVVNIKYEEIKEMEHKIENLE